MTDTTVTGLLTLAGLVIGYFLKGIGDLLQHRHVTEREREAREAVRRQQLADRRVEFQRQTLLELQQAAMDLGRSSGQINVADRRSYRTTGKWHAEPLGDDLSERHRLHQAHTSLLMARVRDDSVRDLVAKLKSSTADISMSKSPEDSDRAMVEVINCSKELNHRIGEILRQMDDSDGHLALIG